MVLLRNYESSICYAPCIVLKWYCTIMISLGVTSSGTITITPTVGQ